MFHLTRLRLFLLEHAAGLSISSRNIGNDNNTACPYCTAGPAVFARVRLETNQSADCPDERDKVQSETDRSGLVRITEGQVKTARPCSFYICLCFCFCLRFYFVFAVVSAFGFASLLFSFFYFFFFLIILSFILFLLSFFSYLSYVPWRPFCPWWTKYANGAVFRSTISITGIFYNTDWPPTADRHFVRISVRISQTICRYNSALRHIKKLRYSQGNNGTLK